MFPPPLTNPKTIIKARGINLPIVATVCIKPPVLEPKEFKTDISNITPIVIGNTKDSFPINPALC